MTGPSEALPRITLGQHSLAAPGGPNQDFHGAMLPTGHLLASKGIALAIADGISSSPVSQEAAQTAVGAFLADYYATSESWSVRRAGQRVIAATNAWLHAQTMRGDARFDKDRGHVCTFTALVLKGCELHLLHVGDARLCRLHAATLEPLSEDHRVQVSSAESYLARALGAGAQVEIDYRHWEAEPGEVYLLATDGAHAHLAAADMHEALRLHADDFDAAAAALTRRARERGSDDDATVLLLRIDALPAPGQPLPQLSREGLALPPLLSVGMAFEGFTLVRELKVSPRSHIWLATDDESGVPVALKMPGPDLREDAAALDRFVLEEWVARRIDHPHVLKAWPGQRARRHLFVAMAYVEGQTLAQWMVDHPRPSLDEVRALLDQIGRGLQALHGREMLHQDLRPENVMIDRAGTARLIDLASAHVAGLAEGRGPLAADAPGTLQYMAPEYLLGQGGSARSDLFALAALGYQTLTGQLPYGLTATRVRQPQDLRRLRYVPLRHHRPDLPAWLDTVLQKALSPQPARRHEAVSELLHELRSPSPEVRHARAVPLAQRDPVRFWQAVAAALMAVVVLLFGRLVLHA
ncbi:bifunctional protein-serine/threonine kinase/phosphatase [Pseudacidovorax sp. RU35E]|uniref:bifunctional protein-serine/threonine kinase/phosphatase n=1 Tax=Pseudacidovorax sp. RU35E TaxID=1907403 RepID=UPI000953AC47|nr:bifunctional protein-serine/threonine kinase/phosphatase [Pseudacidovorax sp. RU35E]SIR30234.1 Serine/threonine protein kinase [Pseudacidovorax sp. RU35E]